MGRHDNGAGERDCVEAGPGCEGLVGAADLHVWAGRTKGRVRETAWRLAQAAKAWLAPRTSATGALPRNACAAALVISPVSN
jgi:hypothetical protein